MNSEQHSQKTYQAARNLILSEPKSPLGGGFAHQLISEAKNRKWVVLGVGLAILARQLFQHPEMVKEVTQIIGNKTLPD